MGTLCKMFKVFLIFSITFTASWLEKPELEVFYHFEPNIVEKGRMLRAHCTGCVYTPVGKLKWGFKTTSIEPLTNSTYMTETQNGLCDRWFDSVLAMPVTDRFRGAQLLCSSAGFEYDELTATSKVFEFAIYPQKPILKVDFPENGPFVTVGGTLNAECSACVGNIGRVKIGMRPPGYPKQGQYFLNWGKRTQMNGGPNCGTKEILNIEIDIWQDQIGGSTLFCTSNGSTRYRNLMTEVEPFKIAIWFKPPTLTVEYHRAPSYLDPQQRLKATCRACIGTIGTLKWGITSTKSQQKNVHQVHQGTKQLSQVGGDCGSKMVSELSIEILSIYEGEQLLCTSSGTFDDDTFVAKSLKFKFEIEAKKPTLTVNYHRAPSFVNNKQQLTAKCNACLGTQGQLQWGFLPEGGSVRTLNNQDTRTERKNVLNCGTQVESNLTIMVDKTFVGAQILCSSKSSFSEDKFLVRSLAFVIEISPQKPKITINALGKPPYVTEGNILSGRCSGCIGTRGKLEWKLIKKGSNGKRQSLPIRGAVLRNATKGGPECGTLVVKTIEVTVVKNFKGAQLVCTSSGGINDDKTLHSGPVFEFKVKLGKPVLTIDFTTEPSFVYPGTKLTGTCTACTGQSGKLRWGFQPADSMTVVNLDTKDIKSQRLASYNRECIKKVESKFSIDVTHKFHGARVFCTSSGNFRSEDYTSKSIAFQVLVEIKPQKPNLTVEYQEKAQFGNQYVDHDEWSLTARCKACIGTRGQLRWALKNCTGHMVVTYDNKDERIKKKGDKNCVTVVISILVLNVTDVLEGAQLMCTSNGNFDQNEFVSYSETFQFNKKIEGGDDVFNWMLLVTVLFFTLIGVLILVMAKSLWCTSCGGQSKSGGGQSKSGGGQSKSYGGQSEAYGGQSKSDGGQRKSGGGQSKSSGGQRKSYGEQRMSCGGLRMSYGGQSKSSGGQRKSCGGQSNRKQSGNLKEDGKVDYDDYKTRYHRQSGYSSNLV